MPGINLVLVVAGIVLLLATGLHTLGLVLLVIGVALTLLQLLFFGFILSRFRRL